MIPSDVKATLSFSDGSPSMELPIYKGSIGPDVIDIRKLYAQTVHEYLHRRRQG
jgi:citrate synthase